MLTLLTTTCDQPAGFALCESFMRRQTIWGRQAIEWIVVDDGDVPIQPTCGQRYLRRQREPDCTGAQSLCRNLLAGLDAATGDAIAIVEHDDWYAPWHLERMLEQLARPHVQIAGDLRQRYYHVRRRQWRVFQNRGACLCQTAFRIALRPFVQDVVQARLWRNSYGVDTQLWTTVPRQQQALVPVDSVVGIKGLPGRPGLGIGHRPNDSWSDDPDLVMLRAWIGPDAARYAPFGAPAATDEERTVPHGAVVDAVGY